MAFRHLFQTALLCAGLFATVSAQDRNIQVNEVYPPDMFKLDGIATNANENRRIINVRSVPSAIGPSAVGDGVADDSDAIINVMEWVMAQLRAHWGTSGTPSSPFWEEGWIIYFPNGTYRVTKPLVYSGTKIPDPYIRTATNREGTCRLMLVGQSRAGTIIRLSDNNAAFGASVTKPVVSFARFDWSPPTINNNIPAGFHFRNFTINTGTGNPGAVGLEFYGANYSRLDNVRVVGDGKVGVHLRVATAHGYYSNVIVDGMNYGIYMQDVGDNGNDGAMETHATFEYVTLNNQLTTGIYQQGVSSSLRKIQSSNAVTALHVAPLGVRLPQALIIDSNLANGTSGATAIQVDAGELYARNISVSGYGSTVKKGSTVAATGAITEYLTSPPIINGGRANPGIVSLNLPIEEYPVVSWVSDFAQWANVDNYAGSTDAQKAQAAMNSGRKVVYFPKNSYDFGSTTVTIPASVEQVIGSSTKIKGLGGDIFSVNEESLDHLLVFNHLTLDNGQIAQSEHRDLLLESTLGRANLYKSQLTDAGTKLYVNNANGFMREPGMVNNIKAWVRWNDNEKPADWQFTASAGSTVWMFGFKSEKTWSVFQVVPGARLEVLGGVTSRQGTDPGTDRVAILNNGGDLSIITNTIRNGTVNDRLWSPMIQDVQTGLPTLNLAMTYSGFVPRGWTGNIIIPLYASYTPANGLPTAPTNLTATAGNQQVTLNWTAATGATSYSVYRGLTPGGQGGTPIATGITTTTYPNTGLTNGTTYYYKVAGVNGNGTGALSNEAVATPGTGTTKLTVAAATASDSELLNGPSKAIDGSTSTRWSASVLSCPPAHWLQLDLGSVQTVNTVKTLFFNGLTYTYDISVSTDNVIFTTVVPSHNTTVPYAWETDAFAPISARYIRINISSKNGTGPNTKPGIHEAEVYH